VKYIIKEMGKLFEELKQDVRFQEGMNACINCGVCTAICPAAEYYDYDPRRIVDTMQREDDNELEELLKSDTIWFCGECMSCKTRCPRNNTAGLIIMALRTLSQEKGYFVNSEKGRQQLFLKRTIGHTILETGYCVYCEGLSVDDYPEQGPIWDWRQQHWSDVMYRVGANYKLIGSGAMRKIPDDAMEELHKIFEITGANKRFEKIEVYSRAKAEELGEQLDDTNNNEYMHNLFVRNSIQSNK
jgi:heterodisulfide reductase subunit C